jgi:hypothetical protein
MKPFLFAVVRGILCLIICSGAARASRITGTVTDEKGGILPYSSIWVKGGSQGVTASKEGKYMLELAPGTYTIVCQYVGYARQERQVVLGQENVVIDFHLSLQQLSMAEVVVRPGGEDPAYAIIRHAIKKRKDYEAPLDSFTCEAYIKTIISTRSIPSKILGQPIQEDDKKEMGVDSSGKGIIYLSESMTKVFFKKPDKVKLEVLSGRVSGSNGFGFGIPTFVSFYNNNVTVLGEQLNPRGFISPIADAALNYYRYKYLGSFFEDGKEINKIQVIPKRKYEPLFSGTINIVDGDWRIHSLDILLLRQNQLEILDTLQIRQIHGPVADGIWQIRSQVIYFTFGIMGFSAVGNFLNVYNNYDITPRFKRKFFNNVLIRFDTAVNKHTRAYWDSVRPVPLEPEELRNYTVRDSIYINRRELEKSGRSRDSLLKKQGPVTALQILSTGFRRSNFNPRTPFHYGMEGLLPNVEYNTVEGINANVNGYLSIPAGGGLLTLSPNFRYGFSNTHFYTWADLTYRKRSFAWNEEDASSSRQAWTIAGGKRVEQFNADKPISEYVNGLYTLLLRQNFMKIYENYFGEIKSVHRFDNGLRFTVDALYEDRMPLMNTTDYSLFHPEGHEFTPNFPYEKLDAPFHHHQALLTTLAVEFQPGQRFIEFPDRKVSIGSKYPILDLSYVKGWKGALGSDVDFDKWQFSIQDDANFKLRGMLRYRFSIGGFLNDRSVFIQDYQHFNGNQTIFASHYLNGFQLAPYYANSTIASLYATGHIEHHFNGFLTNKIPWFRKLNWNLEGGANAFYVNETNNYVEVFGGLENILKIFRFDVVVAYLNGHYEQTGLRIGFGGILGSGFKR